jgi:hypothetical protein
MSDFCADDGEETRLLIDRTQGVRPLEALHDIYSRRLHRRSSDFDATRGLRLVIAKLQRIAHASPAVTTSS